MIKVNIIYPVALLKGMNCECGFKFSGPGEIRNCGAFITEKGHSGIICPECGKRYVKINGDWCIFDEVKE